MLLLLLLLLACTSGSKDSAGHHPDGYAAAEVHGLAAKLQEETCVGCHGEDLTGGTAEVSCDGCHAEGWRTDCVLCHGGEADLTGAPPVDIDPDSAVSYPEHTVHGQETIHSAWDCTTCHTKPTDVLSAGHVFVGDSTRAVAEVDLTGGLSAEGSYDGSGTCSNLYCHGNGQDGSRGAATSGDTADCAMCHGDRGSAWELSGEHHEHVEEFDCDECHGETVTGSSTVSNPANHVDGERDLALPAGMEWNNGRCDGDCHRERHTNAAWDR